MVKRLKKGPRLGFKMNYDPVVEDRNTTGMTSISIQTYEKYTAQPAGLILKDLKSKKAIGCCIEPAAEVLRRVFPECYVLEFNSYSFFANHDFNAPMTGLSIQRVNSNANVKKTLDELLAAKVFERLKREVSPKELEKIRAHITGEDHLGVGNPRLMRKALYKDGRQIDFDEKEILSLIGITQ